jgi:hypothetical protein
VHRLSAELSSLGAIVASLVGARYRGRTTPGRTLLLGFVLGWLAVRTTITPRTSSSP